MLLFAYSTIALFSIVVFLSIWIVMFHQLSMNREQRISLVRNALKQDILSFLNGRLEKASVSRSLAVNPQLVLGLFAQCLVLRPDHDREKLIELLECKPLNKIPAEILKNLRSKRWHKRQQASTYAAYALPAELACTQLLLVLKDPKPAVRLTAARGLAKMGVPATVKPIVTMLAGTSNLPDQRITEVLCEFKSSIIAELVALLKAQTTNVHVPRIVVNTLSKLRAYDTLTSIAAYLRSEDRQLKIESIKALGQLKARQYVPDLIKIMDEPEWELRAICAKALGDIGDPRSAERLSNCLGDPVWWVRHNSSKALVNMGTTGIRLLEKNLGNQDTFAHDMSRLALNDLHFQQSIIGA